MNKNVKKLIAGITAYGFILTATLTSVIASPLVTTTGFSGRLGGKDRYETASIVAQSGWSTGSDYVIIARGDDFADALCATPLAKHYNAPILLTDSKKLISSTEAEIKALKPKHIIIIGGTGAVTAAVEQKLKGLASDVQRVAGSDRYDTSVKVANTLGKSTKIAVVRGDQFADALSIAPVAAAESMPVILTKTDKLPDEVKSYLAANKISVSYVIGGTGAVNDAVKSQLPGSERISGSDRFETNKNVLENFEDDLNFEKVFVAVGAGRLGNEFADALSASALAAKTSSPVVIEYKGIEAGTVSFINNAITPKTAVIPVGGTAVVSDNDVKTLTIVKQDYPTDDKTYTNEQVSTNANITGKNVTFKDGKVSGNVYVYGDGAQLSNVQVAGTVFVDPGESGSVTLSGVKADKIKILSGAQNSIHLNNVLANALLVESKNTGASVRVVCEGTTAIASTVVKSDVKLDASAGTFGSVQVITTGSESKKVELSGTFDKPIIVAGSAELSADTGAKITEVKLSTTSSSAVVSLVSGDLGKVTVASAAKVEVGAAAKAEIAPTSSDVAKDVTLDVKKGATVTVPASSGFNITGPGAADVKEETPVTPGIPSGPGVTYALDFTCTNVGTSVKIAVTDNIPSDIGKGVTIVITDSNGLVYPDQIDDFTGSYEFDTTLAYGNYTVSVTSATTNKTKTITVAHSQSTLKTFSLITPSKTYTYPSQIDITRSVSDVYDKEIRGIINLVYTSEKADIISNKLTTTMIGSTPANQYIASILRTKNGGNSTLADILDSKTDHSVNVTDLIAYIENNTFDTLIENVMLKTAGDITISDPVTINGKTVGSIKVNNKTIFSSTDRTISVAELKEALGITSSVKVVTLQELLSKDLDIEVLDNTVGTPNVIYSAKKVSDGNYTITTSTGTYKIVVQ